MPPRYAACYVCLVAFLPIHIVGRNVNFPPFQDGRWNRKDRPTTDIRRLAEASKFCRANWIAALNRLQGNPPVSCGYEGRDVILVHAVFIDVCRQRCSVETVKRNEEIDRGTVVPNQVLKQEEVDISLEAAEQLEKVGIARQCFTKRAVLVLVVTPDALQGEVEAVLDLAVEPACAIDGRLSIDLSSRKYHVSADSAAN